jgi:hypothetical protein
MLDTGIHAALQPWERALEATRELIDRLQVRRAAL